MLKQAPGVVPVVDLGVYLSEEFFLGFVCFFVAAIVCCFEEHPERLQLLYAKPL